METSLLIAQILGPIYVVISLGMLMNKGHYTNVFNDFIKSDALMYIGGVMAMAIGLLIVQAHNVWVKDWTVLVTIVGWIAVLKGVMLFVFPGVMKKQTKAMMKGNMLQVASIVALVLGSAFTYFGYFQ